MKAYQNGRVSFRNVVFFQLEEFRGIPKDDERSFASRMYEYFFKYVDACSKNVYFLDGTSVDFEEECRRFEKSIKGYGGLRLVCAEVNSEAGIGGNTPGSCLTSRTRQKTRTSFILNDPVPHAQWRAGCRRGEGGRGRARDGKQLRADDGAGNHHGGAGGDRSVRGVSCGARAASRAGGVD